MNRIIEELESNVRSYCRSFPVTFRRARGSILVDDNERSYIDLFAGAGVLNYGHNEPRLRDAAIEYMQGDGMIHGLDLTTEAKEQFLETFRDVILQPRHLEYKVMFPGPTGTNAVESALKIARKITGRSHVVAFTNAFHGMTLGALALTGNQGKREGAGVSLGGVTRMPFDGYLGEGVDTLDYLETALLDSSSGVELPAAIIVETVQAEGGINVASKKWLVRLQAIARRHGVLLIVDDIQMGCGRTGPFFSFEGLGITPDILCLSKSLSGYGLPFALTLMHPDIDALNPGQHNGTFRGNNLAFVTATKSLDLFWRGAGLQPESQMKAALVSQRLQAIAAKYGGVHRGRGLIQGIAFAEPELASAASREAFKRGVVIETSGAKDEVLKCLPALTIETELLLQALDLVSEAVSAAANSLVKRRNTHVSSAVELPS